MTAVVDHERAPAPRDPRARLPKSLLLLLGAAGAVAVVAGMRSFSSTLGPAFLALVLVILVSPLQVALRRRRVPAWAAIVALLVVLYAGVFGLAAAAVWSVARLATLLTTYRDEFVDLSNQVLDVAGRFGIDQSQINQLTSSIDTGKVVSAASGLLSGVSSGLSAFTLILLLLFFLALDASPFPALLARASRTHPDAVAALHTFASGTRRYLAVATVFGAVVAALDVVVLYALGVPLPLLWGLLAFLTNYIANIGFVLGLVPPALLALLANGPRDAIILVIIYTVINVVIQGMIQPKVAGDAVGLSASLTFLSVIFWGFALGGIGALLAVPLSLLARVVLVDADPSARWLLPLIGGQANDHDDDPDSPHGTDTDDEPGDAPAEHAGSSTGSAGAASAAPVGAAARTGMPSPSRHDASPSAAAGRSGASAADAS